MKTTRKTLRSRAGSALFTVMIYSGIAAMAVGVMMTFALNQPKMVQRAVAYTKAKAIAEAGANQAYSILATNFAAKDDPSLFPLTPFDDGAYDVTIQTNTDKWVTIVSVATCKDARATAVLDLQNFGGGTTGSSTPGEGGPGDTNHPGIGAFAYAILSGGTMDWSGSGTLNAGGGKIHSNGKNNMVGTKEVIGNFSSSVSVTLKGSTKISGDANAPTISVAGGATVTGTKTEGPVPAVTIPDIDLTPYYNEAVKNGQVTNGSPYHVGGSGDFVIPGGILWVNGDFKWSGSGNIVGCVIATGNIDWGGSGDHIKYGDYPAFISRDGDISYSGSGKTHGLIYAKTGTYDRSGSGAHWGQIICNGAFDASGSWDLLTYENSTPVPPSGGGSGSGTGSAGSGKLPDIVVPTAWVK